MLKLATALLWWLTVGVTFGLVASLPDLYDQISDRTLSLDASRLTEHGDFLPAAIALCGAGALTLVRQRGDAPAAMRNVAIVVTFLVGVAASVYFGQVHAELRALALAGTPPTPQDLATIGDLSWKLYVASVLTSSWCAVLSEW